MRRPKAVVAIFLICISLLAVPCTVRADQGLFSVTNAPVINISIAGGTVTIRTWDRAQVQTESNVPLQVQQFSSAQMARNVPREITVLAGQTPSPRGVLTLPRETFVLGASASGAHDGLAITGSGGETTITIPSSTALLVARMPRGFVTLDGYRGGTFFVRLRNGWVHLLNLGGEGFVQVMRGPIVASDSTFVRLRARSAIGNMLFVRCHARQIEVSSIAGSVSYDNGSFEPGLARFETQYGNVALGVGSGNAQIVAHSEGGRILYNYERRATVDARGNDATAAVGANGPLVNVSSGGSILLYDGVLRARSRLNGGWRVAGDAVQRVQRRVERPPPQIQPRRPPARPRPIRPSAIH